MTIRPTKPKTWCRVAATLKSAPSRKRIGAENISPSSKRIIAVVDNVMQLPARCSCAEIEGEDPQCPLHGMTIELVAAWSDQDCMIDPEIDSFTVRRFAQECLTRLSPAPEGVDARPNPNEIEEGFKRWRLHGRVLNDGDFAAFRGGVDFINQRQVAKRVGKAGGALIWAFTAEAFADGTVNCDWHDVPGSETHWDVSREAKEWVKSQVDEMVNNPGRCPYAPPSQATHSLIGPGTKALSRPPAEQVRMREALLSVVGAVRDYLPPDGIDAQTLINRVIGAVDNPEINPLIREIENGRS